MKCSKLIVLLQICIMVYLEVGIASAKKTQNGEGEQQPEQVHPTARSRKNSRKSSTSGSKRGVPRSGRKLRMLNKILKRLTPEDVYQLTRIRKEHQAHAHQDKKSQDEYRKSREEQLTSQILSITLEQQATSDVPDCPRARDGVQLFSCPTPDRYGIYRCIDDHALCDNKPDCPNREDENKTVCMFHKMTMNYFKVLMDAVFGLTRSMV